ncbi:hypothetical protein F2Q69_00031814 [Brassica cretica]|uniref:Uncharacterized protein n=1 Tax=Brassica cretica TaxID=69181 RepID=A0A8S9SBE6_BRACR|nr:hypothetical protein F2Q69_00031814 [Brassica cretica]
MNNPAPRATVVISPPLFIVPEPPRHHKKKRAKTEPPSHHRRPPILTAINHIVGGPLFSGLGVTGVTIWYQSGVPSRPRPGMAIRMFSSRWVRGDVSVRQSSQELSVSSVTIPRLSRSGYVTVLLPPYFKQSFHEFLLLEITWCDFVNSWGSLLDESASACVVLILGLAWFCLLVFGIVDRFRGVEFFEDSSEMELSLCDVILEKDWLS